MPVLKISDQRREDMLIGALEGGSNGWYSLEEEACGIINKYSVKSANNSIAEKMWRALQAGETISIHDVENPDEKLGEINMKKIEEGEELMLEKSEKHYLNIITEEDDAETADVWFQYCVLKSIVYG